MYIGNDGIEHLNDDPTRDAERILENFLAQWHKEELNNALQKQQDEAELLPRLARIFNALANAVDFRAVIGQVMDACVETIPADRVMLLLRNQDGKLNVSLMRGLGTADQLLNDHRMIIQQVLRHKKPQQLTIPEENASGSVCRKWFFPVIAGKNLFGILYMEGKPRDENQNLHMAQVWAELIAMTLQHSQLAQGKQLLAGHLGNMQARVLHFDKIALRGRLAVPIGHELNNLLSVIAGNLELARSWLQNGENPAEIVARFDMLQPILASASYLAQNLTSHADTSTRFLRCSLPQMTHEIIELLKPLYGGRGVQFNLQVSAKLPDILACPAQIRQILYNLLLNTLEMGAASEFHISLLFDEQAQRVKLFIAATGAELEKRDLELLSSPAFTGSESGIGLGLLISRQIVEDHGGSLSVDNQPGKGCTYVISLPHYGAEKQLCYRKKMNR